MKKKIFIVLVIIGVIIISILSFTLPSDPFATISTSVPVTPTWKVWCFSILGGSLIYFGALYGIYLIYKKLKKEK